MDMGAVGHERTNVAVACNTRSWSLDKQCCKSRPGIALSLWGFELKGYAK